MVRCKSFHSCTKSWKSGTEENKDILPPAISLAKAVDKRLILFSLFPVLNLPFITVPMTRKVFVLLADPTPGPRQQVRLGQVRPCAAVVILAGLEQGQQRQSGVTSQAVFYHKKSKPNCWQRDAEAFVMPTAKRAPCCDLIRCHVLTRYFMEGFYSLYGRHCWWISGMLSSESGLNSILVDTVGVYSGKSLAINIFCCCGHFSVIFAKVHVIM